MVLALGPWQILKRQQRRFVEHQRRPPSPGRVPPPCTLSARAIRHPSRRGAAGRHPGQPRHRFAWTEPGGRWRIHGAHRRSASWQVGGECKSAVAIAHFGRTKTKESHAAVEPARARGARPDPAAFSRALGTADTLGTTYLPRLAVLRGLFKIRTRARAWFGRACRSRAALAAMSREPRPRRRQRFLLAERERAEPATAGNWQLHCNSTSRQENRKT